MDQELAVSLRTEDRRRGHRSSAEAESGRLLDDLAEDRPVNRRVANDAMIRPAPADLELRLHESDDRAAGPLSFPQGRGDRPEDQCQGDERDVDHREIDRLAQGVAGQRPGVRPVVDDDPRVPGNPVRKLAATHVDGMDPGGAPLEKDVAEATCRCADIQAHPAGRVDPEGLERCGQLVPAATDVRIPLDQADRHLAVDEITRLAIRSGGVAVTGPDLAGKDQCLGLRARLGQTTLDEELIETLAERSFGRRATHRAIVAQPSSPRLTRESSIACDTAAMISRPISLILAAGLLILIGVSGMAAGGGLLGAASGRGPAQSGLGQAAAIGAVMGAYGFAAVFAGVALLLFRRWAWRLGIFLILIGLAVLVAVNVIVGALDPVLLFGVAVWGANLWFLMAPATRSAVQGQG
jgi:hypothetical protein